jgi:hypothetical protein
MKYFFIFFFLSYFVRGEPRQGDTFEIYLFILEQAERRIFLLKEEIKFRVFIAKLMPMTFVGVDFVDQMKLSTDRAGHNSAINF